MTNCILIKIRIQESYQHELIRLDNPQNPHRPLKAAPQLPERFERRYQDYF